MEGVDGCNLGRCLVNEELSRKIMCLLRHGTRNPIAVDAYGHVMFGDLTQCILHRYRYLAEHLSRGEAAGVSLRDVYPYAIGCLKLERGRGENRVFIIGKQSPTERR